MLALFRITQLEPGSDILIDGVSTSSSSMTLYQLRSKLTIIHQDPVMFSGTLRYNLDPLNEYSDSQVWEALDRCQLKSEIVARFPGQLRYEISE